MNLLVLIDDPDIPRSLSREIRLGSGALLAPRPNESGQPKDQCYDRDTGGDFASEQHRERAANDWIVRYFEEEFQRVSLLAGVPDKADGRWQKAERENNPSRHATMTPTIPRRSRCTSEGLGVDGGLATIRPVAASVVPSRR